MSTVHWPAGHEPDGAAIHQTNRGRSDAPPERVWAWLIRPDLWHTYYDNASGMEHLAGPWPELALGTRFSWKTFDVRVTTEVTECQLHSRLAWTGSGRGSRGHHAWVLSPDGSGTIIHTEETQRGIASRLARPILRPRMDREHQNWVDRLATTAVASAPPLAQR